MASVPEIILNNPFRVLGVYANSSYREIVAGVSKATKFMEVWNREDNLSSLQNKVVLYKSGGIAAAYSKSYR